MRRRLAADDKEAMSLRSSVAVFLAVLACLAMPAAAFAVGLGGQRVVSSPQRTASASSLIASSAVCPSQDDPSAPTSAQVKAMECLVDFARQRAGLNELAADDALGQSARSKSHDVIRCDSFSHFACDREFTYWMDVSGYTAVPCWRVGENLAWGTGEQGSARSIFVAWMRSPTHRANILGDFAESGISLELGSLEGKPATRVWAEHFGTHC